MVEDRNGYQNRWQVLKKLGSGGQGTVSLVYDIQKVGMFSDVALEARSALQEIVREDALNITRHERPDGKVVLVRETVSLQKHFQRLIDVLKRVEASSLPENQGALKVLHSAEDSRDADRAEERIQREIEAMKEVSHPNLLKILDSNVSQKWFVSEYHPRRTLADHLELFRGNLFDSLKAIRPLVEGVATLHAKKIVHRDIKPQNVFVASDGRLVLGDFGLERSNKTGLGGSR